VRLGLIRNGRELTDTERKEIIDYINDHQDDDVDEIDAFLMNKYNCSRTNIRMCYLGYLSRITRKED
jgi:hypothetical protein